MMLLPNLQSLVEHEEHLQVSNLQVERMGLHRQHLGVDALRRVALFRVVALRCSSMFVGLLPQSV